MEKPKQFCKSNGYFAGFRGNYGRRQGSLDSSEAMMEVGEEVDRRLSRLEELENPDATIINGKVYYLDD